MDNITRSHIEQIQLASRQNRLVIFVGAGVSANSGVPLWGSLIDSFKDELPEHLKEETDYLKLAQLYRDLRGEKEFFDKVKDILKYEKVSPNEIHKEILDLNPCHIVTTNYDDLLEQSALTYNHQYYVVRQDIDLPANKGEKMIIKMHGDFSLGNIVLTENDYFDYSRNFPLIKSYVVSLFATKLVLFVGFSFNDINLKYILRNVRNVLGDKMQQAYMLTDKCLDSLTNSYFKSKGVCLINNDINAKEEQLGENIKQQLYEINHYDKYEDDIIEIIISFLKEYGDQITYLGKYVRNIFPKEKRKNIYITAGKMSLSESYKEKFSESVQNESRRESLYNKYGDDWYELIAFLLNNQVLEIDGFNLNTDKYLEEYNKRHPVLAADMYYDLDLVQIYNYIQNLQTKSLKYSKEDLQLPFILYKIGNHLDAYKLFKSLSKEFWKKRKYFLYYISIFNVRSLARILAFPLYNTPCVDYKFYEKEYLSIDLQEILNELPIEERLKSILNDLFSFKVINDLFNEVAKLQSEIAKQRKSAENGGSSLNSNIQMLLHSFRQLFDFCNENCIINDFYTESKDVYKKIGEGVIDSVMTQENPVGFQTKLEKLYEENIFLFVFQLTPDALKDIFSIHVEKPIPVDESFCKKLTALIKNLTKYLENDVYRILPQETVANYVKNIILLYNNIDATPEIESIYQLIIDTWAIGRFGLWIEQLNYFYEKLKPSPEHSRTLIYKILETNTLGREIEADYAAKLSKISVTEGNIKLQIPKERIFAKNTNVIYLASFVKAVDEETQKDIIKHVRENAKSLYDLVMSEIYTGEHFLTKELIKRFREHVGDKKGMFYHTEELACKYLLKLCNERKELKNACADLGETCACIRFLSSPLAFKPIDEVKDTWLLYCEDNDLKGLLKNETIKEKAKKYIEENPWHNSFKNRFFKLV